MTVTETPEYKKLALDSSNDMIRYDSRWVLGEYEQAALHIRQAGLARLRMGQIMLDAGQFAYATEDWLSAAACFGQATDPGRMRACIERVRQLGQEGKIPTERRDLHAALKERAEELRALDQKLAQFRQDYSRMVGPLRTASREALDFLLRQVRDLPGSAKLHAEISGQALQLGQRSLAVESLNWAERFDPGSSHLGALRVSQLITFGEPVRAAQIGQELLAAHPGMSCLRVLLAQALAFRAESRADARVSDWEAAIEVLQPLVENGAADLFDRLVALSLAATLRHGLGHEDEYRRLLHSFDRLAEAVQSPAERAVVTGLRQSLPHVFPQPGSNGAAPAAAEKHHPPAEPDYATLRRVFGQLNPLTAGTAA